MTDPVEKILSPADQQRIEACVKAAERLTRGEIVVLAAPASSAYPQAGLIGAATVSIPAAVALARWLGPLLWAGPHDLWVFLGIVFPLFFLCREIVARLPRLRRLFIAEADMTHEVREAALVEFHRRGLHRTREGLGVLIYLSVFEAKVWVLGDHGVDHAAPAGFWQALADEVASGVRQGRAAEAVCAAVERIRALLAEQFPPAAGDVNELPDLIVR